MQNVKKLKQELRQLLKQNPIEYNADISKQLTHNIIQILQRYSFKTIGLYFPKDQEPPLADLIQWLKDHQKQIAIPYIKEEEMYFSLISSDYLQNQNIVTLNQKYNFFEPFTTEMSTVEIVLIPAMAFSKKGVRLGYGKGFYDRYLQINQVISIGVTAQAKLLTEIPQATHDVALNYIVTEHECICC